jgi:SWI/SNF-related matrix-associated actin-dependent regulator of chromatin subfamily A protein 2/4
MWKCHPCFNDSAGKQLMGEEAPLASQLQAWLDAHPGWEAHEEEDDDDEDEDDDEDDVSEDNSEEEEQDDSASSE